jgi:hypothetical protein
MWWPILQELALVFLPFPKLNGRHVYAAHLRNSKITNWQGPHTAEFLKRPSVFTLELLKEAVHTSGHNIPLQPAASLGF